MMPEVPYVELHSNECQWTLMMISQHWFRQQAITWINVDPDLFRHMVSLGHNELIMVGFSIITHMEMIYSAIAMNFSIMFSIHWRLV